MRSAALLLLFSASAAAQPIHLGQVERWFLALGPLHEARACIEADDALRPALESLLHDTQAEALRAIHNDYERGMLAGRLSERARLSGSPNEDQCRGILANVARGLLRLRIH
jgi:hypothetical protein